jgi:hypothetical protein
MKRKVRRFAEGGIPLPSDRATGFRDLVKDYEKIPEEKKEQLRDLGIDVASLMIPDIGAGKVAMSIVKKGAGNFSKLSESQIAKFIENLAKEKPPAIDRKPGLWRNPEAKQKADMEMRRRIKDIEDKKRLAEGKPVRNKSKHEKTANKTAPEGITGSEYTTSRAANSDISGVERDVSRNFDEYRKGGRVKSKGTTRGDGIAQRGRTRGRFV